VPDDLEVVAFDTGVYVAGILRGLPPGRHLAARMIQAARAGAFQLLVLDGVVAEYLNVASREDRRQQGEELLLEFLQACPHCDWPGSPSEAEIDRTYTRFLPYVPDPEDARIAVEVSAFQPDYFIHCNPPHWSSAADAVCGTRVRRISEWLEAHGIPVPRRNPPIPRRFPP
jgi:hypothetical protein